MPRRVARRDWRPDELTGSLVPLPATIYFYACSTPGCGFWMSPCDLTQREVDEIERAIREGVLP